MSAIREVRPEASRVTSLKLVPTPAPARGYLKTILVSVFIVLSALVAVFVMNTWMVSTAYELQSVRSELSRETAREETLQNDVISASTPKNLSDKAAALGLVKAGSVQHIDLSTGIILPAATK